LEELKRKGEQDKAFIESQYKEKIRLLEIDLKEARKGFEHERSVLEKKRTDM
jgi:hypothetical protein